MKYPSCILLIWSKLDFKFRKGRLTFKYDQNQGLYKDRHSYGRSTMSTQLVGVFNFPILKFEEGKSAPGVAFCSKGSVFRNGGVHPSGKPSNWFIFEIIVDC